MKKVFILIFVSFSLSLFAQVPGYQGKRLIIKDNVSFCPLMGMIMGYDKPGDLNFKNEFGADFVINRNTVLGIYYDFINDQILYVDHKYTHYDPCYPSQNIYYDVDLPVDVYGGTYFLSWKRFSFRNTGAIAPLGRYVCIDAGYTKINVSDNGTFNQDPSKTDLGNYTSATLLFGFGKQSVIFNRITVDMGVRAGAAFSGVLHGSRYTEGSFGASDLYFKVENKLFTSYLINASIGIGLLVK